MIEENERRGKPPDSAPRQILAYAGRDRRRPRWRRLALLVPMLLIAGALVVYALLPGLNWPRDGEGYNRLKCASNLRQIGQALTIYSNEHGGMYPPSLDEIVLNADLTPEVFICPYTNDARARGNTPQEWIQDFRTPGHNSFVYVIGSVPETTLTANHVVAHDVATNHGSEGINVLYGDGRVDWISRREKSHLLAELQAGHNPPRPPLPGGG